MADRDDLTLEALRDVEQRLGDALQSLPNHVDSIFDAAMDTPAIADAMYAVRTVLLGAVSRQRAQRDAH